MDMGFNTYKCLDYNVALIFTTFANGFDPEQAPRFVGPDLDPNCLTLIPSKNTAACKTLKPVLQ